MNISRINIKKWHLVRLIDGWLLDSESTAECNPNYSLARKRSALELRHALGIQYTQPTCAYCGEMFEQRRADKIYCGASCNTMASRARKKAAAATG